MTQTQQNPQNDIAGRVYSIDALRGFDMFWIIGGGALFASLGKAFPHPVTEWIQVQLEHVTWRGFHFEDLIFPLFLFIMGAVLPFALSRRLELGQSRLNLFLHILRRTVLLILLGLMYNGLLNLEFSQMRWAGVLQRIGLCYFFTTLLVLFTRWRAQVIILLVILLGYWAAVMLIPVPGYGPGVITMEGCLPSYIDQLLLPGKLYYGYGDNEGLLSTLPAIATSLLGVLAGHWLRAPRSGNQKSVGLFLAGLLCLIIGYFWGIWFAVIKIIWTSSYVLVSAGWSLLLLAAFYWLIDVKGFRRWAFFFKVIGLNAITIYFLQRVVDFGSIGEFFFSGLYSHAGVFAPVVLAAGHLAVIWLFLCFLYRYKIFLKV